jgi:hypothetical protein
MRRAHPWLTAVLALGFVALGCLVLRQKTRIVQLGLNRSDSDLAIRNETAALQRRLVAARDARAKAEKQIAQLKPSGAGPADAAAPAPDPSVRVIHMSDILKDHPEYAAIMTAQARRGVILRFGPALAALNLPPEQLAKLKDLLVERSQSETDAQQAARAAGLKDGTPAWRAAVNEAAAPVEQEMTAIVGTDGTQFARQLQNESSAQSQIQYTYKPDFDEAGASLNPDQSQGLALAIANANYSGKSTAGRPANYNQVDPDTLLTPHDERIITAAAATLSPAQVEILKADLQEPHQQAAIMQQYTGGANGPVNIVP